MLICNCTLVGTLACQSCSNYIKYFGYSWGNSNGWTTTYKLHTYNPETHELIEKKDAKVERIKKNIEELLVELGAKSKEVDEEISKMEKMKETIEGLNKELKELEDK